MELVIEKAALKALRAMQPKVATVMLARLEAIAANPVASHANVKPLTGQKNAFRLRQGDWRAVYIVDRKARRMHVLKVETRGGVYK
jgi:mRNA-degrading endonuclease RelE of RelBE toxin-antitoxin system